LEVSLIMKVAISSNYIDETIGGGNLFIKNKISSYPHNSLKTNKEYLNLFDKLLLRNDKNDFKTNKKSRFLLLFLIYRHKIQKFFKTLLHNFHYHFGKLK